MSNGDKADQAIHARLFALGSKTLELGREYDDPEKKEWLANALQAIVSNDAVVLRKYATGPDMDWENNLLLFDDDAKMDIATDEVQSQNYFQRPSSYGIHVTDAFNKHVLMHAPESMPSKACFFERARYVCDGYSINDVDLKRAGRHALASKQREVLLLPVGRLLTSLKTIVARQKPGATAPLDRVFPNIFFAKVKGRLLTIEVVENNSFSWLVDAYPSGTKNYASGTVIFFFRGPSVDPGEYI